MVAKFSKRKSLIIGIIVLVLMYGFYLAGSCIFWYFAAWSGPEQKRAFKNSLRSLSSQELIRKIHGLDPFTPVPSIAIEILAEREETRAVPRLIKKLKSPNRDLKKFSIVALGKIGDPRAIEPLKKIVDEVQVDIEYSGMEIPDNITALKALARMKYEPAYKTAVDLAALENDPNHFRVYGIAMLEYFEKLESMPVLEKIYLNDPESYIRDKAKKVMEKIQSLPQSQSPQEIAK